MTSINVLEPRCCDMGKKWWWY